MAGTGQMVGAAAGAGLGAAFGGPAGAQLGLQLGSAGGQLFDGLQAKKEAEGNTPPMEDTEVRMLLDEVNQKRKSLETGSAFASGKREIGQNTAAAMEGIKDVAGGNTGAAIEAMNKAQRIGATDVNRLLANADQMQTYFTTLATDLTKGIAQRKLDLQMYDRVQALAEAAQNQKDGKANMMATAARSMPLEGATGGQATGTNPNGLPPIMQTPPQTAPASGPVGTSDPAWQNRQAELDAIIDKDFLPGGIFGPTQ